MGKFVGWNILKQIDQKQIKYELVAKIDGLKRKRQYSVTYKGALVGYVLKTERGWYRDFKNGRRRFYDGWQVVDKTGKVINEDRWNHRIDVTHTLIAAKFFDKS